MSLSKQKIDFFRKEEVYLLGTNANRVLHEDVSLLALYHNTSKSTIIRRAVEQLIKEQLGDSSIIIKELALRVLQKKPQDVDYDKYIPIIIDNLKSKKISGKHIKQIREEIMKQISYDTSKQISQTNRRT